MYLSTETTNPVDFKAGQMLLVSKPLEWTSFDVVNKIRFALRTYYGKKIKVGHAGTLDPLADGLLIICTGTFTKRLSEFQGLDKCYTGAMILGATTPSFDLETDVDQTFDIKDITTDNLEDTVTKLSGTIEQMPPQFSAVKKDGMAAYKSAREGIKVELKTRTVNIKQFELTKVDLPNIEFFVECSKGTYIRSLANDFGALLDNGAHLSQLTRTSIGEYNLENAWQLDDLISFIHGTHTEDEGI